MISTKCYDLQTTMFLSRMDMIFRSLYIFLVFFSPELYSCCSQAEKMNSSIKNSKRTKLFHDEIPPLIQTFIPVQSKAHFRFSLKRETYIDLWGTVIEHHQLRTCFAEILGTYHCWFLLMKSVLSVSENWPLWSFCCLAWPHVMDRTLKKNFSYSGTMSVYHSMQWTSWFGRWLPPSRHKPLNFDKAFSFLKLQKQHKGWICH